MNAKTPADRILTDEDRELLASVAEKLRRKELTLPAVLFLESVRPLNFLASQAVHFFNPALSFFIGNWSRRERFAELLEERESVDYLIQLLEGPEASSSPR